MIWGKRDDDDGSWNVCCRLRNEAWASQCLLRNKKTCATPRVGQDRRLSVAMTLAVAHEQGSHDLGESKRSWI